MNCYDVKQHRHMTDQTSALLLYKKMSCSFYCSFDFSDQQLPNQLHMSCRIQTTQVHTVEYMSSHESCDSPASTMHSYDVSSSSRSCGSMTSACLGDTPKNAASNLLRSFSFPLRLGRPCIPGTSKKKKKKTCNFVSCKSMI